MGIVNVAGLPKSVPGERRNRKPEVLGRDLSGMANAPDMD
jgi:hypothetical protein